MPEDVIQVALFLALIFMGFWRRVGWLMMICGIGVVGLSLEMIADDVLYGLPYLFVGFGMFIIGALRLPITGK